MSAFLKVHPGTVPEGASLKIAGTLKDENGTTLGSAAVGALTLHLNNKATGAVVNGRNGASILNTAGGTLDVDGNFTLKLAPADMVILDPTLATEEREALITWTYNGGADKGRLVFRFVVENLAPVSA